MITDAAVLTRLIEADPRLGSVVAEARDIGMNDSHIVDTIAYILADECKRRFGSPPRTLLSHLSEEAQKKTR